METWVKINESVTDYTQHQTQTAAAGDKAYTITGDDFNQTPDLAGNYTNPNTGQTVDLSQTDTGDAGAYSLLFGQVFDVQTVYNIDTSNQGQTKQIEDHKFIITGSSDGTIVTSDTKPADGAFIQEPNKTFSGVSTYTDPSGKVTTDPSTWTHTGIDYHSYVWVDAGPAGGASGSGGGGTGSGGGGTGSGGGSSDSSDLTASETTFGSDLINSGALQAAHPFEAVGQFIRNHSDEFLAAVSDIAGRSDIQGEAQDVIQGSLSGNIPPLKAILGGVAAGVGASIFADVAAAGAALGAGTVGAGVVGAVLVVGGLAYAADAELGTNSLGYLEDHIKQVFHSSEVRNNAF